MTNPNDPNQQWAQTQLNASGGQPAAPAPFSDAEYAAAQHAPGATGDPWAAPGPAAPGSTQQSFAQQSGPQPFGQATGAQQFGQLGPQAAWGPPAPAKKSYKWWFIGGGGLALLLIIGLVVGVAVAVTSGGSGSSGSPEAVVQTYLDGLAAGDAKKALSVSVTPASEDLLTDEILKKQRAIAPITDIVVRKPDSAYTYATVNVTYKHGQKNVDEDVRVRKSGDDWKIDNGAIAVTLTSATDRVPGLTLFGKDVSNDTKVYVFPGPLVWGSTNTNVTPTDSKKDDYPLGPDSFYYASLSATLSETGRQTVTKALDAYLTNCATSTQPRASTDRPGCGQSTTSSAQPGSVRWTKPTDLSQLRIDLSYGDVGKARVSGSVTWGVSYTSDSGPQTTTANDYMSGTVDLNAAQPTYTE